MPPNATREHIDLIVARRDRLVVAASEAFDQVVAEVERSTWTPSESVAWWQWSRTLGIPHAARRMIAALGSKLAELQQWAECPPDQRTTLSGGWPMGHQGTPARGTPCVYLLFDRDRCLYVGQSVNVRARLKTHWRAKVVPASSWNIIPCSTLLEALRLEADLIFQHQPEYNYVGRGSRVYPGARA